MLGITDLWLFVISGIVLNMIPGPDSLYILGYGARQGFKAGSVAAIGIGSGILVHIFAAAFGLSALLATSTFAFTLIKIIGCIYLLYIGLNLLLTRNKSDSVQALKAGKSTLPLKKIFYGGFFTNVLNPKVALFFLAFMPQFISADAPHKALSFIFLGMIFIFTGMLWCHFLAWSAASVSKKLNQQTALGLWLNRLAGSLFVLFAAKLAFTAQRD